jgi:hypothetical protein
MARHGLEKSGRGRFCDGRIGVTARMLAERIWPSMAANSPKNAPASMSRRMVSGPEIMTRATPLIRKNTSVLSS